MDIKRGLMRVPPSKLKLEFAEKRIRELEKEIEELKEKIKRGSL